MNFEEIYETTYKALLPVAQEIGANQAGGVAFIITLLSIAGKCHALVHHELPTEEELQVYTEAIQQGFNDVVINLAEKMEGDKN